MNKNYHCEKCGGNHPDNMCMKIYPDDVDEFGFDGEDSPAEVTVTEPSVNLSIPEDPRNREERKQKEKKRSSKKIRTIGI